MRRELLQSLTVAELDEDVDRPLLVVLVLVDTDLSSTADTYSIQACRYDSQPKSNSQFQMPAF